MLKKAEECERVKNENLQLRKVIEETCAFGDIISRSDRMGEIFKRIRKICDYTMNVLILGEPGTGKELIAKALHYNGSRKAAPFTAVNCGEIPEQLLAIELFGRSKGSFNDTTNEKEGLLDEACGGTLFLDEITEMTLPLQLRLLQELQGGEIGRDRAEVSRIVDVRVIASSSKDLAAEAAAGRFRVDLYCKLNFFTLALPPLRERLEDVPLLVDHFLHKHGKRMGRPGVRTSPEALKALVHYSWPGNVRELEDCIERGLVLSESGMLVLSCLPETVRRTIGVNRRESDLQNCLSIKSGVEALERELIARAMKQTGGNRTHAVKLLEISHRALLYKLKDYGIE